MGVEDGSEMGQMGQMCVLGGGYNQSRPRRDDSKSVQMTIHFSFHALAQNNTIFGSIMQCKNDEIFIRVDVLNAFFYANLTVVFYRDRSCATLIRVCKRRRMRHSRVSARRTLPFCRSMWRICAWHSGMRGRGGA